VKKAELQEYQPDQWGGMFESKEEFLRVRKENGHAQNLRFRDDFLGIVADTGNYRNIEWSDGQPYIVLMAPELKESIKTALQKTDLDPDIRKRLEQLDGEVTEDSNPVIIMMDVK
jgi:hypothetical protein